MPDDVAAIPDIVRQHAEGAAFLWTQRSAMFHDPTLGETEIGRNDRRLLAHLAGLRSSGNHALSELQSRFEDFPETGEAFALLSVGLASNDQNIVAGILECASPFPDCYKGLSGAVAGVAAAQLGPFVQNWHSATEVLPRFLALTAYSHHRIDPGDNLSAPLSDDDTQVRARALRLIGEVARTDQLGSVMAALEAGDEVERFSAARSALFLGQREAALPVLRQLATGTGEFADPALELVVLADEGPDLRKWLGELVRIPERTQAAIEVSGEIRQQDVRDWLIELAASPEMSAAAGRALRASFDFDFDDTDAFEPDPTLLGQGFEDRDDGPWPVPERLRAAISDHAGSGTFRCLPALRRQCLRGAITTPGQILAPWCGWRNYPAWS